MQIAYIKGAHTYIGLLKLSTGHYYYATATNRIELISKLFNHLTN